MKTPADFYALLGEWLSEEWVGHLGWDQKTISGFFSHGIPIDWASSIEESSKGKIPVARWPKVLHGPKVLHSREQKSIVGDMETSHRVAISRGRKTKDEFLKAIRQKGYTQNSLAEAIGIAPSLLSMYRRKERPIPKERAERIEALTGWPADAKHWPCGILTDG